MKFRNTDLVAFEAIYEANWQSLYISAFKILKSKEKASSIVQEIFVDLLNDRALLKKKELGAQLAVRVRYKVLEVISRGSGHDELLASLSKYISDGQVEHLPAPSVEIDNFKLSYSAESF